MSELSWVFYYIFGKSMSFFIHEFRPSSEPLSILQTYVYSQRLTPDTRTGEDCNFGTSPFLPESKLPDLFRDGEGTSRSSFFWEVHRIRLYFIGRTSSLSPSRLDLSLSWVTKSLLSTLPHLLKWSRSPCRWT